MLPYTSTQHTHKHIYMDIHTVININEQEL